MAIQHVVPQPPNVVASPIDALASVQFDTLASGAFVDCGLFDQVTSVVQPHGLKRDPVDDGDRDCVDGRGQPGVGSGNAGNDIHMNGVEENWICPMSVNEPSRKVFARYRFTP